MSRLERLTQQPKETISSLLLKMTSIEEGENPRNISAFLSSAPPPVERDEEEISKIAQAAPTVLQKLDQQIKKESSSNIYRFYAAADVLETLGEIHDPRVQATIADAFLTPNFRKDAEKIITNPAWPIMPETISYLIANGQLNLAFFILQNNPTAGIKGNKISSELQESLHTIIVEKNPLSQAAAITVSFLKQKGEISPKLEQAAKKVISAHFKKFLKITRKYPKYQDKLARRLFNRNLSQAIDLRSVNLNLSFSEYFPCLEEWHAWLRLMQKSSEDFDVELAGKLEKSDKVNAVEQYRLLMLALQAKATKRLDKALINLCKDNNESKN